MWSKVLLLTLVGLAASEHGWKNGNQYRYELRARTMAGIHQVADQYTGIVFKGNLNIFPKGEDLLNLQVQNLQQAEVHTNLSDGWSTYLQDHDLKYQQLPISDKPFELKFKNGVVDEMYVDKNLPTWEVNILKAIASQLQVDTQAENIKRSKMNQVPSGGMPMGVFKTVEDTVTGECETVYDISPLPQYVLQSRPELAPLPHLKGDGQFIDIVKTKNYSNCEQRMAYHFGLTGLTDWEPASNQMGSFLSRSSISRIVISGQLKSFTIQSSVTTNKVILAPHLYNTQKGIVASRMNLTLEAVTSSSGSPPAVSNPRTIKNLVYEYNAATQEENAQNHHMNRQGQGENSSSSSSESGSQSGENSSSSSSSSSSSQENSNQQGENTMSRSRRSVGSGNQNRRNKSGSSSSESSSSSSSDSSSSSSTSSSEEEFWQPKPKLSDAPQSPFMPYSIGYEGNSIQASKEIDGVSVVPKLAREIAEEFQYENGVTGGNTLTKFTILVGVIHTMNAEQLQQATQKLYIHYAKISKDSREDATKYQAWAAYRDAVAQVGTGPALLTIKQWIKEGKIVGEEAAEVVGVLAGSARYPTTEYMNTFFELVKSEEVRKQRHLNTTALISFTDLVRKAQVSKEIAHNRYPVHSFGRLAPKNDKVVTEQYIPYFEEQLQKAVQQGDSLRIQTYTRALGNTAHPKILAVFEPYLEGQQHTSDFQRLAIVASFDRMTKIYPSLIRSVLFKIYQNSGETPEVRTAAVIQLMKTNPPAQILQRMAQHTNYDHSRQVNAAVKSAIENAAQLEGPENYQLSQNAKSAVNLLTTQEFGTQESHNFLRDYVVKGEELMYKAQLSYIQGEDSIVPSTAFYSVWRSLGGYQRPPMQFGWTTSGLGSLMELLSDQFSEGETEHLKQQRQGHSSEGEGQWSIEKIGKLLNVQPEEAQQVEGNVLLHLFGAQRYFAFDNHTIEQLPQYVRDLYQQLRSGQRFYQSKIYNQYSVQIGFPTETGLPFFYHFSTPTRAYLGGEITAQTNPDLAGHEDTITIPKSVTLKGDLQIIYTTKTEGVLGFSTPYDHKAYVAALGKNLHVAVPVRASVEIDSTNNKVEATVHPLQTESKQKLFEYSTVAYTSQHDILDLSPIVEGQNTEQIHARPVQRIETTFGQAATGFAFDIKAESEMKFIDWATLYKAWERHDGLSAFLYADYQQSISNNNFTITYNPQKSTAKYTKFSFAYNERQQQEGQTERSASGDNLAIPSSASPQDQQRQNEFLQRAGAGIKDGYSQVVDVAVQFDGQTKAEYVATAAYGRSPVDQKSRYLVFYGMKPAKSQDKISPYQVAVQIDTKVPNVPLMDFQKALRADPMSYITAKVNFGETANSKGQVTLQGKLRQSGARREFVQQHPLGALCQQQMQEGNYILPACRNATASANFLDQYRFTFNYESVPSSFKQFIYKAYSIGRYFGYEYVDENVVAQHGKEGEVEIGFDFEEDLRSVNISIGTQAFSSEFNNVEIYEWISPLFVAHPEYNVYQRFGQELFRSQQYPTCVVDKNQATTFNNRSYPLTIGKCWHAMVHPHKRSHYGHQNQRAQYDEEDFSILVREGSSNQKELLILLGKDVIQVQPSGSSEVLGKVTFNGQNADFSKDKLAQFKNKHGDLYVQVYALPSGEVRILAPETGIEIIYDGYRVKLQASNYFRNSVHGLCGTFNGEYATDFETPKNCILKNPFEFAASYAIVDDSCQGPAKELHQKAQSAPCFWENVMLGNVVSEEEAGRNEDSSRKHSPSNKLQGMGAMKNEEMCTKLRVKIVGQPGKTCFSLRPLVSCSSKCKSSNKIEKQVDFHCVPNSAATKHWTNMINSGANPDFSQKPSNASFKLHVPERCIPK